MSDLVPIPLGSAMTRRTAGRHLARVDANTSMELATMNAGADLQAARVQAVCHVGRQAMQSVAMVSQLEGQLGQMVPLAVSRLEAIADMTAFATAEIVADTARRIMP